MVSNGRTLPLQDLLCAPMLYRLLILVGDALAALASRCYEVAMQWA
jgi:hypothetical protein